MGSSIEIEINKKSDILIYRISTHFGVVNSKLRTVTGEPCSNLHGEGLLEQAACQLIRVSGLTIGALSENYY